MRINLAALIPAYNESAVIAKTIASILNAGITAGHVYVIDDGSRDETAEIAASFGVNVLKNNVNLGKSESVTRALNMLHLLERYTHICFLDADTLVHPDYFKVIRERLSKEIKKCEEATKKGLAFKPIGVLCGSPKSIPHNWLTAWRAYQYFLGETIHKPGQERFRAIVVAPGCAATYDSEILKKIKWENDTRTEDMDATIQANLLGSRILNEPNAIVYTQDPAKLKDYIGQVAGRWYKGTWQLMNKYGLLWKDPFGHINWEFRMTMILEPLLVLASFFWAYKTGNFRTGVIFIFSQTIILAIWASLKEKRSDILIYSPVFPFMWLFDFFLFLKTSINIITGPSKRNKWYSVERYAMKTEMLNLRKEAVWERSCR